LKGHASQLAEMSSGANVLKGHGFTACGKTSLAMWFVTGHEFTRAANAAEMMSGFSPC
jgi:hypothetical protein